MRLLVFTLPSKLTLLVCKGLASMYSMTHL